MDKREAINKARLVEPIVRHRVQDSLFYKQYLHLTNESTILPVIVEHVHYVAGSDSNNRPSPFLCCLVKLLEIEPSGEILKLYLDQNGYREFKYLTALALIYCRMVMTSGDFISLHDEYITDYRKIRFRPKSPTVHDGRVEHFTCIHIDEWVDDLATKERVVDLKMPYMTPRVLLAARGEINGREYGDELSDTHNISESAGSSDYESDSD